MWHAAKVLQPEFEPRPAAFVASALNHSTTCAPGKISSQRRRIFQGEYLSALVCHMLAGAQSGLPLVSTDHRCWNSALLSLSTQIQLCNKRPQLVWSWMELILIRSMGPWNLQGLWPTDQIIRNTEKIDEAAMTSRDLLCTCLNLFVWVCVCVCV